MKMNIAPKDALEIKVTAQRWMWTFDYPQGINSSSELVVPAGKPVKLLMSSTDVIHSFFVPDFRIKMDVLPNRYTMVWFEAPNVGEHNIFCTEYCGKGHSEMLGKVRVVGEREYAEWLEKSARAWRLVCRWKITAPRFINLAAASPAILSMALPMSVQAFQGIFGHQVGLQDGKQITVDENYIRESVLDPQAKVVAGFQPVMPTYQGILKDRDIDAIVAYIKSLSNQGAK